MFGSGWVAAEDRGLLLLEGFGPAYLATLDVPGHQPVRASSPPRVRLRPAPQTIRFVGGAGERAAARGREGPPGVARSAGLDRRHQRLRGSRRSRPGRSCRTAKLTDAIAGFAFIGSIFGNGGGNEVANSDFLARLRAPARHRAPGLKVFRDLREVNDPEAPTTIREGVPLRRGPERADARRDGDRPRARRAVRRARPSSAATASRRLGVELHHRRRPGTPPTGIRWP